MSEGIVNQLQDAIVALDPEKAGAIALKGLEEGMDPLDLINQAIRPALDLLGSRFSVGDIFLPELVLSAKAADAAVKVIEPALLKAGSSNRKLGKILMASVKGDIHDIGKNICTLLMKAAGFEVFDIGVDRTIEDIYAAAVEHKADVIGLSALLTTTIPRMLEFIELLKENGVRDKYKVIIGGAPVTQAYADEIGADGYGADASRAVNVAKALVSA
jgi:5-methyltetrahydrofolate--homocysteine methyltransferase